MVVIILCNGCIDYSKREYIGGKNNNTRWIVDKFNYDGHQYIEFYDFGEMRGDSSVGFVHDPDCPCHNKEN